MQLTGQAGKAGWRAAGAWWLSVAGLTAAFARNFSGMWRRWFPAWNRAGLGLYDRLVQGDSYYTHGPLIPLVSLLMAVLLIRHTKIPVRPKRLTGSIVLGFSLLLHLGACLARANFASGFALIGVLAGLILLLWGGAALRRLWFPLAFLIFMVPLPEVSVASLNFRLKMLAASWAVALAEKLGLVVARSGSQVFLAGDKRLMIGNVCNGLRTLISLLAFGAVYAYVCRLRGLWRLGLFAMTIPVAVASNTLRIASLILVADVLTPEAATGWYHDLSGMMIFVIAFLLLFALERLVLWLRRVARRPGGVRPLFGGVAAGPEDRRQWQRLVRAAGGRAGWIAASALVLTAVGAWRLNASLPNTWRKNVAGSWLPIRLNVAGRQWHSYDMTLDERTLTILQTRDYLFRRYVTAEATPVDLCIIFSSDDRKGIHPPELCFEGSGSEVVAKADLTLTPVAGRGAVPCRELVVQSGLRKEYLLYTYKCGGNYTRSFWTQQFTIFVNGLLDRNASGALIRLSTHVEAGLAEARERTAQLLRVAIPHLSRALP